MKNISKESENNCNTNIERNYNYNKKNTIPYLMENTEVCKESKASPEEIKEMEELLKNLEQRKRVD